MVCNGSDTEESDDERSYDKGSSNNPLDVEESDDDKLDNKRSNKKDLGKNKWYDKESYEDGDRYNKDGFLARDSL